MQLGGSQQLGVSQQLVSSHSSSVAGRSSQLAGTQLNGAQIHGRQRGSPQLDSSEAVRSAARYTARQLAARQLAVTQQLARSPPHPRRSRAPRVGHSSLATRAFCDVVALCPVSLPRASVLVPVLSTSHILTLVISRSPVSE